MLVLHYWLSLCRCVIWFQCLFEYRRQYQKFSQIVIKLIDDLMSTPFISIVFGVWMCCDLADDRQCVHSIDVPLKTLFEWSVDRRCDWMSTSGQWFGPQNLSTGFEAIFHSKTIIIVTKNKTFVGYHYKTEIFCKAVKHLCDFTLFVIQTQIYVSFQCISEFRAQLKSNVSSVYTWIAFECNSTNHYHLINIFQFLLNRFPTDVLNSWTD